MAITKRIEKTKESLIKLLEMLEQETVARAQKFVKNAIPKDRGKLADEKILAGLKKLGVASQSEIKAIKDRLDKIEEKLAPKE
ncbi:hypothetical protein WDW86_16255 [Bdellovibrionota bacterium FG-2]